MVIQLLHARINLTTRRIQAGETAARLSGREAALLRYLIAHTDRVVPRGELLTEVFEYAPTVQSRVVDTTVARLRRKIEPNPHQPTHLLSEHGVGYRFVLPAAPPPAAPLLPRLLDPTLDTYIERPALTAALHSALQQSKLVTVVGAAGVGKTRLVLEHARHHPGTLICPQEGVTTPAAAARRLARLLGRGNAPDAELRDLIITGLRQTDTEHIVFDGLPAGVPGLVEIIDELRTRFPALRLIFTAHGPTGLRGERLVPVSPMTEDAARALFTDRARATGCSRLPAQLDAILERIDRLPLAVEMLAGRLRYLDPDDLLDQLHRPLDALQPGRDGPLIQSFQAAYQPLSDSERRMLWAAARFPAGVRHATLRRLFHAPATLQRLCDTGWLHPDDGRRLLVYACARDFVLQQSPPEGIDASLFDWAEQAAADNRADIEGPQPGRALRWLEAEAENLAALVQSMPPAQHRAAATDLIFGLNRIGHTELAASLIRPLPPDSPELTLALVRQDIAEQRWSDAHDRLTALLEGPLPPTLRGEVLRQRGSLLQIAGRYAEAHADLSASIDLLDAPEHTRQRALARHRLGLLIWQRNQAAHVAAEATLEEALAELRSVGALLSAGICMGTLGQLIQWLNRPEDSLRWLVESMRIAEQSGHPRSIIYTATSLSMAHLNSDALPEAESLLLCTLVLAEDLGQAAAQGDLLYRLGILRALQGQLAEAEEALREAEIHLAARRRSTVGVVRIWRAVIIRLRGQPDRAALLARRSLELLSSEENESRTAARLMAVTVLAGIGDVDAAREQLVLGRDRITAPTPQLAALIAIAEAEVALCSGDVASAREALAAAAIVRRSDVRLTRRALQARLAAEGKPQQPRAER